MSDSRKYAIYSRKSKFTGKGESISNQVEICRSELISRHGVREEDIVVFEDEGYTGANTRRPRFQEMMRRCREGEFRSVICYRLDRISRNTADFVRTYEELKEHSVCFLSVNDNIDDTTPMGKAMMMISSVFAQLERDIIAERIIDNMQELAKMGRWLGGNPPTGYRSTDTVGSVSVDGKERKARKLEQIPEEIGLVRLIFAKFLELCSLTAVQSFLLNENIVTRRGNDFNRFAIKNILQNPVYAINDRDAYLYFTGKGMQVFAGEADFDGKQGVISYNKTRQQAGKANRMRDPSEWIIAVGKHKGVISGRDWSSVQDLLSVNKDKSFRRPRSNVALLSGRLFCAGCGSYMRPKLSDRVNKEGERIYDYLCELKENSKGGRCVMKRISGNRLDKLICGEIKALGSDSLMLVKRLRSYENKVSDTLGDYQSEIDRLVKQKQKLSAECGKLVTVLASAGQSAASKDILEQINSRREEEADLDRRIAEYRQLISRAGSSGENFSALADMLADYASAFDSLDLEKKRSLIRCLVDRVEWDGENVSIYFAGSRSRSNEDSDISPLRDDRK
ncbi:MAG: recombinase family protein [Ruminococcus sp.]|nr:recombinase family protein [Ruminococcus sp.]